MKITTLGAHLDVNSILDDEFQYQKPTVIVTFGDTEVHRFTASSVFLDYNRSDEDEFVEDQMAQFLAVILKRALGELI